MLKYLNYKKFLKTPLSLTLNYLNNGILMNGYLLTIDFKYNVTQFIIISKSQFLIKKTYIKSFFSLFFQFLKGISFGYKFILKLKGKGLRLQFKKKSKFIYIFLKLGYSHKLFFKLPPNCWITLFERRRSLILYSFNYQLLRQLILKIRAYYPVGLYKLRGFFEPTEQIKQKKGNLK